MSISPVGNIKTSDGLPPDTSTQKSNKKNKGFVLSPLDSTSIYFKDKELIELKEELGKQKITEKKLKSWIYSKISAKKKRETRKAEKLRTVDTYQINEISIEMATYCHWLTNKKIFDIAVGNLSKIKITNSERERLQKALKTTKTTVRALEPAITRSIIDQVMTEKRTSLSIKQAETINIFFDKKGFGIVFDKESIFELAKSECSHIFAETSAGKKREAESQANGPVSKKQKTQHSNNNTTTNTFSYNDGSQPNSGNSMHQEQPCNWNDEDDWRLFEIAKVFSSNPGFASDTN